MIAPIIQKALGIGTAAIACTAAIIIPAPHIAIQAEQPRSSSPTENSQTLGATAGNTNQTKLLPEVSPVQEQQPQKGEVDKVEPETHPALTSSIEEDAEVTDSEPEELLVEDTEDLTSVPEVNYEIGSVSEYSGWYSVAVPKGFKYDETIEAFSTEDENDYILFNVFPYSAGYDDFSDEPEETYSTSLDWELRSAQDIYADDPESKIEQRKLAYGQYNWDAIIISSTVPEQSDEVSVTLITDLGQGCYATVSLFHDPETPWVRSMLESFSVKPGDPYDNYATHADAFSADDSTESIIDEGSDWFVADDVDWE